MISIKISSKYRILNPLIQGDISMSTGVVLTHDNIVHLNYIKHILSLQHNTTLFDAETHKDALDLINHSIEFLNGAYSYASEEEMNSVNS
jgi:hypothetical protein